MMRVSPIVKITVENIITIFPVCLSKMLSISTQRHSFVNLSHFVRKSLAYITMKKKRNVLIFSKESLLGLQNGERNIEET